MPVYEYECQQCEKIFEVQQRIADAPLEACPDCSGEVNKLISRSSFQLKGGGWYADGYGSSGKAASKETAEKAEKPAAPPCKGGEKACQGCPAAN